MKKVNKGKTEVIIVGADHPNTLSIIRALGNKYIVNLIIHEDTDRKKIRCSKSVYFNGKLSVIASDEGELVKQILSFQTNDTKPVIIPTSDFAAYYIDYNYDLLCEKFILPSINNKQEQIVQYMDKYEQKKLAEKYNLPMAKTLRVMLSSNAHIDTASEFGFPLIVKPVVSAKGSKSDIAIVQDKTELQKTFLDYIEKGYTYVLIQEFIDMDYELLLSGCITQNSRKIYYGAFKKIRKYPYEKGSTSFAQLIEPDLSTCPILEILRDIGYSGLFDVELFVSKNKVYLNEINFRNSGSAWAFIKKGINPPLIWVMDNLGQQVKQLEGVSKKKGFFMYETTDWHHVVDKKISLLHWIRDLLRTRTFHNCWVKDIPGSLAWLKNRRKV